MKKQLMVLAMSLLMAGIAFAGVPVETLIPVDHIYSPLGFDSNDDTQVIVSGYLPNLCHQTPKTTARVLGNEIHVQVSAYHYQDSSPFCPQVIVPFVKAVSVGVLDKGQYKVVVNRGTTYEQKSDIAIAESVSPAIDDHIYARVDHIDKSAKSRKVLLKGYNPSDCLVLDHIQTVSNGKDTLAVLPMMKQIREFCPMKLVPFAYEYEVPKGLTKEKILLHVRVMEGKSVNTIFDNKIN